MNFVDRRSDIPDVIYSLNCYIFILNSFFFLKDESSFSLSSSSSFSSFLLLSKQLLSIYPLLKSVSAEALPELPDVVYRFFDPL